MQKYRRVALRDRIQIQACIQSGLGVSEIAKNLKFHKTTIYRELKRNKRVDDANYMAIEADLESKNKFKACKRSYKIQGVLLEFTLKRLRQGWTPEQIIRRLRREKSKYHVSYQTIYRLVQRLSIRKTHLRFGYKQRGWGRLNQRKWSRQSRWKLSIHDRPEAANLRSEIGHWERDLFYGKNRKTIFTMTDRKSRYTVFRKNPNFKSEEVAKLTNKVIEEKNLEVKTITNDNGSEFFDVKSLKVPVYFCDVGQPGQRGTIENTIGLIRRFIKKDTDLSQISRKKLQEIEDQINLRPRKCLDYRTPYEVFYNTKVALAV